MTATLGPVSAALEADVRGWVRRHGVVVWLDVDGHYTSFVDRLRQLRASGDVPYEVHAFRGSYLELMLGLEPVTGGVEKRPLLIHLPGFNEDTVRHTPVLELYEAGVRYRKALDTLLSEAAGGRVRPEEIAAFRNQGTLSLEGADTWFAALLDDQQGGLAAQLRAMRPVAVLDDLLGSGFVAERIGLQEDQDALWEQIKAWTGLPASWRDATLPATGLRAEDIAFTAASWALCVEYVDDLKREPVDERLKVVKSFPRPVVDTCHEILNHLRERHAAFYQRAADETEARFDHEEITVTGEELGKVDTFRFEEDEILKAALRTLREKRWNIAWDYAAQRLDGGSFWLRDNPLRKSQWQLVQAAAELGLAIEAAGPTLDVKGGLDQAVARYVNRGARVDQAHRHLEQRRTALLYPQLPEFDTVRDRLDALRRLWRDWADNWARDFNALCRSSGFLPGNALQQRTLFEEVVRPFTQEPGPTALFVIDALRYEMGEELYRMLAGMPASAVHLKARLAELPTVTEVGMNVLAPVMDYGRLRPIMTGGAVGGFSTGEFRVAEPETRKRAMHDRVGGATCPWLTLEEVVSRDAESLKRTVARTRLLVVHSQEIDNAGEKGVGPAVFDYVMQKLSAAWRLLRDAGVRRFVITADHEFLLLDETARSVQAHGRKIDPNRRHIFSSVAADHRGEARAALSDLGYEGVEGYLMFPETTAVFDTGKRAMSFVHGGNSLQERVIPVLTLVHRAAAGTSTIEYAVAARAREEVAGMHCIEAKVDVAAQGALDFGGTHEVELSLRAVDEVSTHVDLCQTRGGARIAGGLLVAQVGEPFEVFFRLSGSADARVQVELLHSTKELAVTPCLVEGRFAVAAARTLVEPASTVLKPTVAPEVDDRAWLDELPSPEVRQFFEYLSAHNAVTESEAAAMLGGQRALRRFALRFEELAAKAPFAVRIDVVAGVKRYVREGIGS